MGLFLNNLKLDFDGVEERELVYARNECKLPNKPNSPQLVSQNYPGELNHYYHSHHFKSDFDGVKGKYNVI